MRIRGRTRQHGADDDRAVGAGRGAAPAPESQEPVPADDAMAAVRRAEEAAAALLAAEEADQAAQEDARRRAAALLDEARARAAGLARERREVAAAEAEAEAERERAAAAAAAGRLRRAAEQRHDLAVELAVTYVLTGESRCSSR
jgi:colicin import membrane protein